MLEDADIHIKELITSYQLLDWMPLSHTATNFCLYILLLHVSLPQLDGVQVETKSPNFLISMKSSRSHQIGKRCLRLVANEKQNPLSPFVQFCTICIKVGGVFWGETKIILTNSSCNNVVAYRM